MIIEPLELEKVEPKILGRSQKGQDSLIEHVFEKIGTTNKYFVEFGAVDGEVSSNTWHLRVNKGWTGLLLDCNYDIPEINLHRHFLTKDNICGILQHYNVPSTFDFLSIDIDGMDYYLLHAILMFYNPRVVMIETNVRFEPYDKAVLQYDETYNYSACGGKGWYGCSPYFMNLLGEQFGYVSVFLHLDDLIMIESSNLHPIDRSKPWGLVYNKARPELYESHNDPVMHDHKWVVL